MGERQMVVSPGDGLVRVGECSVVFAAASCDDPAAIVMSIAEMVDRASEIRAAEMVRLVSEELPTDDKPTDVAVVAQCADAYIGVASGSVTLSIIGRAWSRTLSQDLLPEPVTDIFDDVRTATAGVVPDPDSAVDLRLGAVRAGGFMLGEAGAVERDRVTDHDTAAEPDRLASPPGSADGKSDERTLPPPPPDNVLRVELTPLSSSGPPTAERRLPPRLGMIELNDGTTHPLDANYVIGREPDRSSVAGTAEGTWRIIALADDTVSRSHLTLTLVGREVLVTDLGSSNGTFVEDPGPQSTPRRRVPANTPTPVALGACLSLGKATVRISRAEQGPPPPSNGHDPSVRRPAAPLTRPTPVAGPDDITLDRSMLPEPPAR